MDQPTADHVSHTLSDLGWDPGWATAFLPFDAAGWRPARVVAAQRAAWTIATPDGDREAVIAGRLRHEAVGAGDLPAVGDWVAVAGLDGRDTAVIQAVLPRRTAFGRNTSADGYAGNLAGEQVLAANVDVTLVVTSLDGDFNLRRLERYLAVAWTGGATPVIVLNKADVADDADGLRIAAEAVAPGVEVRTISALTGDGVADLAAQHLRRAGRPSSSARRASASPRSSTPCSARSTCEPARFATTTRAAATRRPTASSSGCPDGGLLIDTPGIRSLGVAGATDGLETTFADIAELADGCRFRDCRHQGEPGCNVRAALDDGRLDPARLASHRKLEREAAHVARASDPIARAAERRRWKAISASVAVHMRHKYGSDQ